MKLYSIKTLLLHFAIAGAYIAATSYFFVVANQPSPVGTGLQQWFCIFLHFTITLVVMLNLPRKATNRADAKKKLLLNLAAIILFVGVLSLFSNPLWNWLWDLRK